MKKKKKKQKTSGDEKVGCLENQIVDLLQEKKQLNELCDLQQQELLSIKVALSRFKNENLKLMTPKKGVALTQNLSNQPITGIAFAAETQILNLEQQIKSKQIEFDQMLLSFNAYKEEQDINAQEFHYKNSQLQQQIHELNDQLSQSQSAIEMSSKQIDKLQFCLDQKQQIIEEQNELISSLTKTKETSINQLSEMAKNVKSFFKTFVSLTNFFFFETTNSCETKL